MKLKDNLYYYPENGGFDANTYVIRDKTTILVDPGSTEYLPSLVQDLKTDGIEPESIDIIANTHLHADHCAANEAFKELSGAKIVIHPLQKKFYRITVLECARFLGMPAYEFTEDALFEGDKFDAGDTELQFVYAPGHSMCSVCFYCRDSKFLICGDVVFKHNTGRTDFPGGNGADLKKSVETLSQLDLEYLLPGHMEIVTGADMVNANFNVIKQYFF